MRRLTVFTGSSHGNASVFTHETRTLGRSLAEQGIGVVYGGGNVGLMGVLADAVLEAGGMVHGVMPQALVEREVAHPGLTQLEVVTDMHQRKRRMAELSDGFIALPGGAGTLEELFEVWTWQHLRIHDKPVGVLDVGGFWQPLQAMVDHLVESGFLTEARRDALIVESEVDDLITRLLAHGSPHRSDVAEGLDVELRDGVLPSEEQLLGLYEAVGWSAYTTDAALLRRAVSGSFHVVTAWAGEQLMGLARVISDGATIAYLQDVLVHPHHHRQGLGRALVDRAFSPVRTVRQHVLLTDAEAGQRAFYEALGFTEVRDTAGEGLRSFVRLGAGHR